MEQGPVGILNFPQVETKRERDDQGGDLFQFFDSRQVTGVFGEFLEHGFHVGFDLIADVAVEDMRSGARFFKQISQEVDIDLIAFELAIDISVQDEVGRGLQRGGIRSAEVGEEMHQGCVAFGDQPVALFEVFASGGEDFVDDPALLIFEERFEGMRGGPEVTVQEADDLGEIRAVERILELLDHAIVFGRVGEGPHAAGQVMLAEIKNCVGEGGRFEGDFGTDASASDSESGFTGGKCPAILFFKVVDINVGACGVGAKDGADRVMGDGFLPIDHGGLDEFVVDDPAVGVVGNIAFSLFEAFEEAGFEVEIEEFAGELNGAGGVLNDLNGFESGEFVKEPAATGVHEQGVALEFHQFEDGGFVGWLEGF